MRASAHLRAWSTLPQRIRAGCDSGLLSNCRADIGFASAHSRGLRRCDLFPRRTVGRSLPQRIRAGYDSGLLSNCRADIGFASAHSCGLRPDIRRSAVEFVNSLPQRIRAGCDAKQYDRAARILLCHSAFARVATPPMKCKDCPYFLCHSAFARVTTAEKQCSALRICCEKVDSFSSVGESGLALTIFPFSFAAKATYVAINDSFGRAIDRFFGANRTGISVSYDFAEHPCL